MSFLFDIFCSFFLLHLHSENTFFFFSTALALHHFSKRRHLCENQRFDSCQFCCFRTNANLKKACFLFLAHYLNNGGPLRWALVTALSWCHIYRPHSPSMAYISMIIQTYIPLRELDAAQPGVSTSLMLQPAPSTNSVLSPLYFPNGTFLISVKLLQWKSTLSSPLNQPPSHSAQKKEKNLSSRFEPHQSL